MAKVKYANTARINRKPDGSIVVSLYVNDSKEYANKVITKARTARTTTTRRKVKISKTDKERHREKIKISGYLEANKWEYVLRVPLTRKDHATTWRAFTDKYRYQHKYAPLQYLMVKGAGELYGVISNAPVEDGKIPLVNMEHEVVGVFDVSMIGAMERMTLQYNRTGTDKAYLNSKGLNKKTYEYINLDNIELFELPDDALLTLGQASIVFTGGTAEENRERFEQCVSAVKKGDMERVKRIMENESVRNQLVADVEKMMKHNNFKGIAASVAGGTENLEITEPVMMMYEGKNRSIVKAKYQGQVVFAKADFETILDRVPMLYFITNWKKGLIYYIGLAKEPLVRFCDHFGYNKYPLHLRDRFLRTAQEKGWDLSEFRMDFIPSAGFYDDDGKFIKSEMMSSYDVDAPENLQYLSYKGKYVDKLARGDEAVLQWLYYENEEFRNKYLYIDENGLPLYWDDKNAKNEAERLAKEHLERWDGKYPVEKTMKMLAGENDDSKRVFWSVAKVFFMLHCRNVMQGVYDADSPVFHEIVSRQAAFLRIQGFDVELFVNKVKEYAMQP